MTFQEYHQNGIQFGSRSGSPFLLQTVCEFSPAGKGLRVLKPAWASGVICTFPQVATVDLIRIHIMTPVDITALPPEL